MLLLAFHFKCFRYQTFMNHELFYQWEAELVESHTFQAHITYVYADANANGSRSKNVAYEKNT